MPLKFQSRRLLTFDGYEVDLRAGELRKHGARIRLQDQPLQVLQLLLELPGEVVTREEMKQKLWPADTFVDFDDGLNTAVKKLRDALGDSAERPRYIETLPRRGYRFIGQVDSDPGLAEEAATESVAARIPSGVSAERLPSRFSTRWIVVALAILIAGLAGVGWRLLSSRSRAPSSKAIAVRSIAVLPLENLSGDATQDYFAAELTDTLTTELARIGSLRIISRSSATQYKGKPLGQIARELDVDAVIEGSVVKSGNRVRVNAQLIQARTDKHLWAETYDRDLQDVLSLQAEIATAVARQVQVTISPQMQARLVSRPRVAPLAYDPYLRATAYLGRTTPADNARAIELLEKSVAADPNFALAYAALAIEYGTRATQFRPAQQEFREKAEAAAARALALDPNLPEAYLARSRLLWTKANRFPHEASVSDLKQALALNPNLSEAHHQLGNIYNHIGLLDKARDHIQSAVKLDPTAPARRFRVGVNLLYQGRWEEALFSLQDSKDFFPSLWAYQNAFALVQLGRTDQAKQRIQDAVHEDTPETAGLLESMDAILAAKSGKNAQAEASIRAAIKRGEQFQHFHHVAYGIASAYALMDKRDDALRWLRRASEDGFPCYPLFAQDRNLDNLRKDPRFIVFMQQLERQWKQYASVL